MSTSPPPVPYPTRVTLHPWFLLTAWLLVIAGLLIGNASTAVWDQDEAAYAGFGRTMLLTGDWVTPSFPYSQPHRKPPLQFWAIAGSYALLGINEFALRLPGVLSVLLSGALLAWRGSFLVGRNAARLGGLVLVSSLSVLGLGKIAFVDALLLLCQTVAALAMLRGITSPNWRSTVVLWIAVAAGLLAKGPPILILVGGMFLTLLVLHPWRWNLVHLHPWFGLPLACMPLFVWGWLSWQADPRLILFLIEWYVLRRVGGSVFGQFGVPGTHFALMFLCLMPWTPFILLALKHVWTGLRRRQHMSVALAAWLIGGWLLWEIPASKLPTYPLGGYPAMALLIGLVLARRGGRDLVWARSSLLRAGWVITICVAAAAGIAFAVLAAIVGEWWAKWLGLAPGLALVAALVVAMRAFRVGQLSRGVGFAVVGALAANLLFWLVTVPGIEGQRGATRRIAEYVARQLPPGSTLLVARATSAPSLPFYAEQAGLKFRDVLDEGPRPPLRLDWSLLRVGGVAAFAQSIRDQSPKRPREEEDALRLERARTALASPGPLALVIDAAQAAALADELRGARIERVTSFMIDKLAYATFVVVLPGQPAPVTPSAP